MFREEIHLDGSKNRTFSISSWLMKIIGHNNRQTKMQRKVEPYKPKKIDQNLSMFHYNINEKPEHSVNKNNASESQNLGMLKKIIKHIEEYFQNSTLHGLRYVGDPLISFGERFFWLTAFFTALTFATYFINNIYSKYDHSPIIISLNPSPTPIESLPFPAITICSMNQAVKKEAEQIMESGTDVEKILLDDYCNSNSSFGNVSNIGEEVGKWENVQKFILRINPPCQETIKACFWQQQEIVCTDVFNNGLTDDGLCCTFNALPRDYIFRNPQDMANLNLSFQHVVDDWNPERGYLPNSSLNALPWRAQGPGTHLGLTLVLDAQLSSYYCSSSTGVGFKVLAHNPLETPKMADFAILIAPGLEARVIVQPKIYDASYTIKNIDIKKRMCYFTKERSLQFYRTYTELNCKLECQTNLTLSLCGCVPFYLPRKFYCIFNVNTKMIIAGNRLKKICSKKKQTCINAAKANTGGLLGLFLGFGALSFVEIFYYLFLKVVCNALQSRRKSKRSIKKKRVVNNSYAFRITH
ncbi:hypothetical protein RI129_004683 [Pyrocoelia pectoralis]|uniref:Uncharacterized protein n=1 Tax=Pyrocoelia pectoralis TaxID=417401 RepID=A0AAN7VM05_9COLE